MSIGFSSREDDDGGECPHSWCGSHMKRHEREMAVLQKECEELKSQLKAKVSLDTVFVADSYESQIAELKAEVASLKDTPGGKRIYGALNEIAKLREENERLKGWFTEQVIRVFRSIDGELVAEIVNSENGKPAYRRAECPELEETRLELSNLAFEWKDREELWKEMMTNQDSATTKFRLLAETRTALVRESLMISQAWLDDKMDDYEWSKLLIKWIEEARKALSESEE